MRESFGKWLERIRVSKGFNQTELAERSGITKSTISYYESDAIKQPRLAQLDKIAKALGIKTQEIRQAFAERAVSQAADDSIPPEIRAIGFDNLDKNDLKEIADFIAFRKAQKEKEK